MDSLTDRGTVRILLDAIVQSFQGRFEIIPRTDDSVGTVSVWYQLLKDLPSRCVLAGGYKLLSEVKHPPSPGEVRHAALDIADGALAQPSSWIAWERVVEAVGVGPEACRNLTNEERRTLNMIGGAWTIKNSINISYERKQFCDAYAEVMLDRRKTKGAIPEVAAVAYDNAPALPPAPNRPEDKLTIPEHQTSDPEAVRSLLDALPGYREKYPNLGETK